MKTINELLEEANAKSAKERDLFIETRSRQEQEVDEFLKRFKTLPAQYRQQFTLIQDDTTYKTLFPSLFEQPVNEEAYAEEFARFDNFITQVRVFEDSINEKAREVLESYINE